MCSFPVLKKGMENWQYWREELRIFSYRALRKKERNTARVSQKYFSSQAQMDFSSGVSALLFQGYLIACLKVNFQLSHSGRKGHEPTHTASTSVTTA